MAELIGSTFSQTEVVRRGEKAIIVRVWGYCMCGPEFGSEGLGGLGFEKGVFGAFGSRGRGLAYLTSVLRV